MTTRLAIGIGCRKGSSAEAVRALVDDVRAGAPNAPASLFTLVDKRDEPGLAAAAALLGLPLGFLAREALQAVLPDVLTRSPAAERRFGLASVAEAAALAGGGPGARLLGPRLARDGVTCAVALVP